jgi:hypothetical protein
MKLWKIGLYIICILIILYLFFYMTTEGFQSEVGSYVPPSAFNGDPLIPPVTTLNVSYNGQYNETYLVAPNIPNLPTFVPLHMDTLNSDGTAAPNMYASTHGVNDYDYKPGQRSFYANAYTFQDAQAMCASFGATLATPGQLSIAAYLAGYWLPFGWASDGNRYSIIPKNMSYRFPKTMKWTIGGSTSSSGSASASPYDSLRLLKTGALPASSSGAGSGSSGQLVAFPICWGVKPTQPTMNVVDFNEMEYSMFTSDVISYVTQPTQSDLLQTVFTPDQAVYALQQTNYNINDGGTNPARKFLIGDSGSSGFANVNREIYKAAVGSAQYNQDNINLTLEPCKILLNTFNNFQAQFNALRKVMSDVSGGVIAMQNAKGENADFQMNMELICEVESPTTSPACARLATLDYEILYNTDKSDISTTRIATLELLNHNLFARQGELCQAMQNLFAIQKILSCPSSNKGIPDCAYRALGPDPNSGSTLMMNDLQPNNVEYLRILLQEISPYFGVTTYQKLIGDILDKLSVMIDMPNLNDFNTSTDNFNAVDKEIKAIRQFLVYNTAGPVV